MINRPEQPTRSETADLANGRLADDLLSGATEIADFIGQPLRRTYYMLENKFILGFKVRGLWRARKSTLRAQYEKIEADLNEKSRSP